MRKVYGGDSDIVTVDDISFEIVGAEFLTIIGPSGSGKPTLLRMTVGLEDTTEEMIHIGGRVVNGAQSQNRDVAVVFQSYTLYPHMTTCKNMSYGLRLMTNLSEDETNQWVMNAAEMMGVTDQLNKCSGNLSGGQQQRIATGRVIVREPSIFLFGEPLSSPDTKLRLHMQTELQQLQDTLGTVTVHVTHDQEEVMTVSDHVVIVDGSEFQQIGTPEEIYGEPQNLFVGDSVGNLPMNQFEVRLPGTSLVANSSSYDLSEQILRCTKQCADGVDEFVLGIWPENISLIDSNEPSAARTFFDVRELVGSDNYLRFDIEGEKHWVRVPGDIKPDTNQKLSLALDREWLHLFRQSDGINILVQEEPPLKMMAGQNT